MAWAKLRGVAWVMGWVAVLELMMVEVTALVWVPGLEME